MQRFFLNPSCITDFHIAFPEETSHQIIHVLRLSEGAEVEMATGDGWVYRVVLRNVSGKKIQGEILEKYSAESEPAIELYLFFPLTQREKVEWILQKATEVGVSGFKPYISRRSLNQDRKLGENRSMRWEKIIREAAEQSKRGKLPFLTAPVKLMEFLEKTDSHLLLAADLGADLGLFDTLSENRAETKAISLIIGPEGGFDSEEVEMMKNKNVKLFSLGNRVLRMETAAIVIPSLIIYASGWLKKPGGD